MRAAQRWRFAGTALPSPTKADAAGRYKRNIEGEGREALVLLVLPYRVPCHRMELPSVIVIGMPVL